MIHLEEKRDVHEWTGGRTATLVIDEPPSRDGRSKQSPYATTVPSARPSALFAAPVALLSLAALAISSLAEHPGDWLLAIARAPAFLVNPDLGDAVARADWLTPAMQGRTLVDVIGAAIAALTVMALIALRICQRIDAASREALEDPAGVYKIVTNQTKPDDRRSVAWHGWTASPACERVKTMVCG